MFLIEKNPRTDLNFGLDILDGVTGFDLKGDGLPGQGLDEDLHPVLVRKTTSSVTRWRRIRNGSGVVCIS